jgi:hypothetical protein
VSRLAELATLRDISVLEPAIEDVVALAAPAVMCHNAGHFRTRAPTAQEDS